VTRTILDFSAKNRIAARHPADKMRLGRVAIGMICDEKFVQYHTGLTFTGA
jgi:hypothetical protein